MKEPITLKTLPLATAQEVFDQVAQHLLTQNRKSLKQDNATVTAKCSYRGDGGLKCAAGCLIADDEYKEEMDERGGMTWGVMCEVNIAPSDHKSLIGDLQTAHDSFPVAEWPGRLKQIAHQRGLAFNH